MEREKGLAKGKILSKKKTKVLFVLNIILNKKDITTCYINIISMTYLMEDI